MTDETEIVRNLITEAINRGYGVKHHNGEYISSSASKACEIPNIMDEVQSTDEEYLLIYSDSNFTKPVGNILLVYGNAPDEVIADHSDNPIINELIEASQ